MKKAIKLLHYTVYNLNITHNCITNMTMDICCNINVPYNKYIKMIHMYMCTYVTKGVLHTI